MELLTDKFLTRLFFSALEIIPDKSLFNVQVINELLADPGIDLSMLHGGDYPGPGSHAGNGRHDVSADDAPFPGFLADDV